MIIYVFYAIFPFLWVPSSFWPSIWVLLPWKQLLLIYLATYLKAVMSASCLLSKFLLIQVIVHHTHCEQKMEIMFIHFSKRHSFEKRLCLRNVKAMTPNTSWWKPLSIPIVKALNSCLDISPKSELVLKQIAGLHQYCRHITAHRGQFQRKADQKNCF